MPNGGVLGSGSGMRLQATTPGVEDRGNFNVSGKGIVHGFEARGTAQLGTPGWWDVQTYIGAFTGPYLLALRAVLVGTGTAENVQAVNNNATSDIVAIGNGVETYHGLSVVIGNSSRVGAKNGSMVGNIRSPSVAIGNGNIAYGISGNGSAGPSTFGNYCRAYNCGWTTVIGDTLRIGADVHDEAQRSDLNILIGSGYQNFRLTNAILIDAKYPNPPDPPTCKGNNTIQIGNETHTGGVWIGPHHLTGSLRELVFRQTADKAVTGTTETSLFGAGEGTRALSELVAGSAVRVEGWANVAWPNTGTVKLRLKLGAVVVLETAAIPITVGSTFDTHVQAAIQVRTGGATGAVIGAMSLDSGGIANRLQVQGAAVTVDLTTAQTLDLTAEISNAGDSITSRIASVEVAR